MKYIATLAAGMALVFPASALADSSSSTCQAYNPQLCSVSTGTATTSSSGTLPFTGLDAVLLAAGGGVLAGTGLVVRKASRKFD
jgi:hypothetical protein